MKRRLMCLALAALMTISAAGCRGSEPADRNQLTRTVRIGHAGSDVHRVDPIGK